MCGFALNKLPSHKKDKVTGVEGHRKYHFNLKFKEFVDQRLTQNVAMKENWEMGQ